MAELPSPPHSKHITLFIASAGGSVALALALQKGWLNNLPDGAVAVICLIPVLSFLCWLWIHPGVKKRRYLLYTCPKMTLLGLVLTCGVVGMAVGAFLWWATHRKVAYAQELSEVREVRKSATPQLTPALAQPQATASPVSTPRYLDSDRGKYFTHKLATSPKGHLLLLVDADDREAWELARQLRELLELAGWTIKAHFRYTPLPDEKGLIVRTSSKVLGLSLANQTLLDALTEVGFHPTLQTSKAVGSQEAVIIVGANQ